MRCGPGAIWKSDENYSRLFLFALDLLRLTMKFNSHHAMLCAVGPGYEPVFRLFRV